MTRVLSFLIAFGFGAAAGGEARFAFGAAAGFCGDGFVAATGRCGAGELFSFGASPTIASATRSATAYMPALSRDNYMHSDAASQGGGLWQRCGAAYLARRARLADPSRRPFAGDAILEAAAAGIRVICAITEGIPTQDMIRVRAALGDFPGTHLIGPNCPGVITPGKRVAGEGAKATFQGGCKIGIMPGYIHTAREDARTGKAIGVISRSGTLTYEAVWQCSELGIGQSTCVGIGGDPVKGLNFIELLSMFDQDPETDGVIMIGEIGGSDEADAAEWIQSNMSKPVASFIAGRTAPPGKRMGHAGAIIGGADDTADAKMARLRDCGVMVAESPADLGSSMAMALDIQAATAG